MACKRKLLEKLDRSTVKMLEIKEEVASFYISAFVFLSDRANGVRCSGVRTDIAMLVEHESLIDLLQKIDG